MPFFHLQFGECHPTLSRGGFLADFVPDFQRFQTLFSGLGQITLQEQNTRQAIQSISNNTFVAGLPRKRQRFVEAFLGCSEIPLLCECGAYCDQCICLPVLVSNFTEKRECFLGGSLRTCPFTPQQKHIGDVRERVSFIILIADFVKDRPRLFELLASSGQIAAQQEDIGNIVQRNGHTVPAASFVGYIERVLIGA